MKRMGTGVALLFVLTLAVGCATPAEQMAILARAKSLRAMPDYVIGNGDTITINVLGHDQYVFTGTVRPDGKVSFPVHGDIQAAGTTPSALGTELEETFKKTLKIVSPQVYVTASNYASKSVTVLGAVAVPGRFPYMGQMRVVDVIGRSLSFTPLASPNRTLLFREVDGAVKIYHVHLRDFFKKGDFSTNFYVRPGDILYVPMHGWAKASAVVSKVMSPISAVFAAVGLGSRTTNLFVPGAVGGGASR